MGKSFLRLFSRVATSRMTQSGMPEFNIPVQINSFFPSDVISDSIKYQFVLLVISKKIQTLLLDIRRPATYRAIFSFDATVLHPKRYFFQFYRLTLR